MEMVDVYTMEGEPAGRTCRTDALGPGDYVRHAVVIIRDGCGRYVLQQRSLKARFFAGKWDVTGGGVQAGETPAQAAAREAGEELGIALDAEALVSLYRYRADYGNGRGAHVFVYGATVAPIEALPAWNAYEVNDARLCGFREFYEAVMYNKDEGFGEALRRFEEEQASPG